MFSAMIRSASFALVLGIAAGTTLAASSTNLNLQVSLDGVSWSNQVSFNPNLGQRRVLVRALVSWNSDDGITPVGFAGLTWQPVVSNVRDTDEIAPFANVGNNTNGGSVEISGDPLNGPFGRVRPFAATGPSGLQSYIVHRHVANSGDAPSGSYLRIARNDVTRWMGTGPTSGTGAVNNFNGVGGIACVQKGLPQVGPTDPAFRFGATDVLIFQFALDAGLLAPGEERTFGVDAPLEGMSRDATTGVRRATWFSSTTDNFGSLTAAVNVTGASITLVPSPAALGLFTCGGLVMTSRRRHHRVARRHATG